jgi:hypothetical protein
MASGGIIANAAGNRLLPGLNPMQGGSAQVIGPNTWRVIGDNMKVPESYIPQDGSQRSEQILAATAKSFGLGLAPQAVLDALAAQPNTATGGDGVALGPRAVTVPAAGQNLAAGLERFAARIEAAVANSGRSGDAAASQAVAAKVDELVSEIRKGGVGASVTIQDRSGDPTETARSTMLALRLR